MKFYGLLYVGERSERHANLRGADPLDVYLRCAALCQASANASAYDYELVTNEPGLLGARASTLGLDLAILGTTFEWPVPLGIPFRSAHFKLELIEQFGTGGYGSKTALLDLDAVITKPLGEVPEGLMAYDISDQVLPAYGQDVVRVDLSRVRGEPVSPRWFGGEFLAGSPSQFAELSLRVRSCWARYVAAIGELHHVGDEMLLSAALAGQPVASATPFIARWWSARTLTLFDRFADVQDRAILHLPADKEFLAAYPVEGFSGPSFVSAYRAHARRKVLARQLAGVFRPDGKVSPRL